MPKCSTSNSPRGRLLSRATVALAVALLSVSTCATLIVAVPSADGIAVAADSRLNRVTAAGDHQVLSDRQVKLVEVSGFLVGAGGKSHLSGRPMWMPLRDYGRAHSKVKTVKALLEGLCAEFTPAYRKDVGDATGEPEIWLLAAGYDSDGVGRVAQIKVPSGDYREMASTRRLAVAWSGDTVIADRMILGIDKRVLDNPRWSEADRRALRERELVFPLGAWNLGDAAELARRLVETSMIWMDLAKGTLAEPELLHPTVGGPIDVGTVTPEGVTWLSRKRMDRIAGENAER